MNTVESRSLAAGKREPLPVFLNGAAGVTMRHLHFHLIFAMLAMVGTLFAADPPRLGPIIATQMIDATTAFNWHENGRSIAVLDVETMTVSLSVVVSTPTPPSFTTSYQGVDGVDHAVTTTATGNSVGAITNAIKAHRIAVAAMQDAFPPAEPNGGEMFVGSLQPRAALRLAA